MWGGLLVLDRSWVQHQACRCLMWCCFCLPYLTGPNSSLLTLPDHPHQHAGDFVSLRRIEHVSLQEAVYALSDLLAGTMCPGQLQPLPLPRAVLGRWHSHTAAATAPLLATCLKLHHGLAADTDTYGRMLQPANKAHNAVHVMHVQRCFTRNKRVVQCRVVCAVITHLRTHKRCMHWLNEYSALQRLLPDQCCPQQQNALNDACHIVSCYATDYSSVQLRWIPPRR